MALVMDLGGLIVSDQSILQEKVTFELVIFCDSCGHSFGNSLIPPSQTITRQSVLTVSSHIVRYGTHKPKMITSLPFPYASSSHPKNSSNPWSGDTSIVYNTERTHGKAHRPYHPCQYKKQVRSPRRCKRRGGYTWRTLEGNKTQPNSGQEYP